MKSTRKRKFNSIVSVKDKSDTSSTDSSDDVDSLVQYSDDEKHMPASETIIEEIKQSEVTQKQPASSFKKTFFIKIPTVQDMKATSEKIIAGGDVVRHSGNFDDNDVTLLVKTFAKVNPGHVKHLILDQIFTMRSQDEYINYLKIWNAVKSKVDFLTFSQCTVPLQFLNHIKAELKNKTENHITIGKLTFENSDKFDYMKTNLNP